MAIVLPRQLAICILNSYPYLREPSAGDSAINIKVPTVRYLKTAIDKQQYQMIPGYTCCIDSCADKADLIDWMNYADKRKQGIFICEVDGTQPWPLPVSMGWDWNARINNRLQLDDINHILEQLGLKLGVCRPLDFKRLGNNILFDDDMRMLKLLANAIWSFRPGWHWVPGVNDAGAPGESLITIQVELRRLSDQELIALSVD